MTALQPGTNLDALLGFVPRFAVGDLVRVRDGGRAVWEVKRRDHWHTDTQPAYELRRGTSHSLRIRFAFDSELEGVDGSVEGPTSAASVTARMTHQE